MYDQINNNNNNNNNTNTNSSSGKKKLHTPANEWLQDTFKNEYLEFHEKTGMLTAVTLYYDAELDYNYQFKGMAGLGFAIYTVWYLLPQDPKLAFKMYMDVTNIYQTRNPKVMFPPQLLAQTQTYSILYLLAKEFGDDVTLNKMEQIIMKVSDGKWFGDENEQFGYFFRLNEKFPRGQQSSLFATHTVLSVGSWQRAFANANDHSRFHAPSVEGVDYPKCGVSKAINDNSSNLHVKIYAATPSAKGEPTSFHITKINMIELSSIEITCNGSKFENYEIDNNIGIIKTNTIIDDMYFIIKNTGYIKPKAKQPFVPITMKNQNIGKM